MSHEPFPFVLISCPCSDLSESEQPPKRSSREIPQPPGGDTDAGEQDRPFDPQHPRSNFSLFPPEHLLYCEECHEIRCPRCVTVEIVSFFCPQCLFETPSSSVRLDGNRCPRNCFNCPICMAHVPLAPNHGDGDPSYILKCEYCMWTSLDCSIKFSSKTKIREQLDKHLKRSRQNNPSLDILQKAIPDIGHRSSITQETQLDDKAESGSESTSAQSQITDPVARFKALQAFYKQQIASSDSTPGSQFSDFTSPRSHISRLASLYNISHNKKTTETRPQPMREALNPSEGLVLSQPPDPTLTLMSQPNSYSSSATLSQKFFQIAGPFPGRPDARTTSSLLPMPTLLRTKRSKRCGSCKHILVKHEYKPDSARYRIRLVALSYVPVVTLRPLHPTPSPDSAAAAGALVPGKAVQFVLTLRNHIFEKVKVSLGTPSVTPGKHAHKVTILCPQFEVGANAEMWDFDPPGESANEVVAGKVYEKGRNWTGVVLEVVPTVVGRRDDRDWREDQDVLEIPVRVRLEWRQTDEAGLAKNKSKEGVVVTEGEGEEDPLARELNYWMVLGAGRVEC